jgi:pyrroline-5-carboxylate reductase
MQKEQKQQRQSTPEPVIADGMTLGIVGAGVMGRTLARGIIAAGKIPKERIWAGDKQTPACEAAGAELGIPVETDFGARVPTADLILICVKPADAPKVLARLRESGLRQDTLLISILAGVSTDRLEALLGTENPIVRAMPNTPAVVGVNLEIDLIARYAARWRETV